MTSRFSGVGLPALAALAVLAAGRAEAHPHVFVTATVEITAGRDHHLESVRNIWWMDELFSSSVVVDFDKNGDGALDAKELAAIGEQVRSSIAEWSFYTFVKVDGQAVAMQKPPKLNVSYDKGRGQLLFDFTMKPATALDLRTAPVTVSNFDDSYFVAFDASAPDAFVTKHLPKGCRTGAATPTQDEAAKSWMATIASIPADATVPADGIKFSDVLSTRFTLDCRPR